MRWLKLFIGIVSMACAFTPLQSKAELDPIATEFQIEFTPFYKCFWGKSVFEYPITCLRAAYRGTQEDKEHYSQEENKADLLDYLHGKLNVFFQKHSLSAHNNAADTYGKYFYLYDHAFAMSIAVSLYGTVHADSYHTKNQLHTWFGEQYSWYSNVLDALLNYSFFLAPPKGWFDAGGYFHQSYKNICDRIEDYEKDKKRQESVGGIPTLKSLHSLIDSAAYSKWYSSDDRYRVKEKMPNTYGIIKNVWNSHLRVFVASIQEDHENVSWIEKDGVTFIDFLCMHGTMSAPSFDRSHSFYEAKKYEWYFRFDLYP